MKNEKKLLSLIVPVLNEVENVEPLYRAVDKVMAGLSGSYEYEILFTDNHSTDGTFENIERLAANDKRIRILRFSRNFGYQRSIYTGYLNAAGDAAIQLDCDMQDPPELIPEFINRWENGARVVYGIRRSRKEAWWLNAIRKAFYRLIDALSEDRLPLDAGDFRLVDRSVIEEMRRFDDCQPYLRGMIAAIGFDQIGIPYDRAERLMGASKFGWGDMFKLAADGILNHSVVPLRIATLTGLVISCATFLGIAVYSIGKLYYGLNWPAGFTTITVLILLSLSINAIFLGIIGEYVGRIYMQVKKRPISIIEREINPSGNRTPQ